VLLADANHWAFPAHRRTAIHREFMVQTLAAADELQRDLQRELRYDGQAARSLDAAAVARRES
jgi:hypothetical protein